jgi:hypothetical protein
MHSDEKSAASVPQISLKFQLDDEQLTDGEIFCGKRAADSWWCD